MKALNEQKKLLDDLGRLIDRMSSEIELLRSIVNRYNLKYGKEIQPGYLKIHENISFDIYGTIDDKNDELAYCKVTDHEKIGIESNYQGIRKEIERLNK